ncbi:MAG TPA: ABC transporter substrate-binding protein [Gemmatimonadales bacterium]|nr:ABC transporter substrate-binding protein [Gemmatimonadales bacterium]
MIPFRKRIILIGFVAACHAGPPRAELPPVPGAAPSDTSCTLAAGAVVARDTVTLAVTAPVEPAHAPLPRNDAERLVFAQLYESLLRVDCQGRALPALARSWSQDGDRWTFALREDARFWDGAPVTALDVVAAWRGRDSALARAVTIADDHTLSVRKRAGGPDTPLRLFADPALAVTKPAPGGGWPIGTGRHWMTGAEAGTPDVLVARPVVRRGLPVVKITSVPPDGARDALDGGADMLVVDDPATLEYAARLRGYTDAPLQWSRTYVLLVPAGQDAGVGDLRLESLREAVHGDARPAEESDGGGGGVGRPWFTDLEHCELGATGGRDAVDAAARRRRILYNQADRSAADLAARLVGLGVLGRGTAAAGVPTAAFASALRAGGDAGYVLELDAHVYDVCRAAALELPPWSSAGKVVPLLDVRSHAVLRRALPRLWSDWDGTLRFAAPAFSP